MEKFLQNHRNLLTVGAGSAGVIYFLNRLLDHSEQRDSIASDVYYEYIYRGNIPISPEEKIVIPETVIKDFANSVADGEYTRGADADWVSAALVDTGYADSITTALHSNEILNITTEMQIDTVLLTGSFGLLALGMFMAAGQIYKSR